MSTFSIAIQHPQQKKDQRSKPIENEFKPSSFLVAERIIKSNTKNILKATRQSFQWIRLTFETTKNNPHIRNLIRFTKVGEDAFAFRDFSGSIMRISYSVQLIVKKSTSKTISFLVNSTLELLWNTFKFFKVLKNYHIFSLTSKIFVPLQGIGGSSFVLSSANRICKEIQISSKLLNNVENKDLKIRQKIDARLLFSVHSTAKNICALIIGLMVSIGSIHAFVAPSVVYLTLGTIILVSEISQSILRETYKLNL